MLVHPINSLRATKQRPFSVLLVALLLSVAVHTAVVNMLFRDWHSASVTMPQLPLTVVLDEPLAPPVNKALEQAAPREPKPRPQPPPVQVLAVHHIPALVVAKVEDVEVPIIFQPTSKTDPAPTITATPAPLATVTPRRADIDIIEPPRFNAAYLQNPEPHYPPLARRLGIEGRVVLRVQVSAKGKPEQIAVAQTSGASLLDDAALKAVQRWTFVPARQGDTPIAHSLDVPVRFRLAQ